MAAAFDQLFQVHGGFAPGLSLHADQRHGEAQVVVGGVLLDQGGELAHGVFQALLFHQKACIGQAQTLVLGVLAKASLEQRDRFVAALQAVQQACFEQDRRDLPFLIRLLLQQRQCFLAAIILLQQHGLAEGELWIVGVFDQQLVEALQQTGAGVRVGFRGRKGEEIEMSVALALQNLLHELERFFVTPGAGQLHGCGALCVETVRGVACPDHCGIQRRLVCAKVFGDTESAFGDAGVLCRMRLLYVIAQGNVEAVALAGKLCDQKCIEGLATE